MLVNTTSCSRSSLCCQLFWPSATQITHFLLCRPDLNRQPRALLKSSSLHSTTPPFMVKVPSGTGERSVACYLPVHVPQTCKLHPVPRRTLCPCYVELLSFRMRQHVWQGSPSAVCHCRHQTSAPMCPVKAKMVDMMRHEIKAHKLRTQARASLAANRPRL